MVGVLLQTVLSKASLDAVNTVRLIGGSVIVAFGLLIIASARHAIPFFGVEHKIHMRKFRNSYLTSSLFGIAFALGWTPRVGALIGSGFTPSAVSAAFGFPYLMS